MKEEKEFICANCGCPKYERIDALYSGTDKNNIDIYYRLIKCVNCNIVSAIKIESAIKIDIK